MTVVEKMARALARCAEPEWPTEAAEENWPDFVPAARAALAAIREPSEGMLMAGAAAPKSDATLTSTNTLTRHLSLTGDIFTAMIDQALSEGQDG